MSNYTKMQKHQSMTSIILCLILYLMISPLCSSQGKKIEECKYECTRILEQEAVKNPTFHKVRELFIDSVYKWKSMGLKYTNNYNRKVWHIDEKICFNSDTTMCKLFILELDTIDKNRFHSIQWVTGQLENMKWNFYYKDQLSYALDKDTLKVKFPNSYKMINNINFGRLNSALEKIISKEYFRDCECNINEEFVNFGFSKYSKESHMKYLNTPAEVDSSKIHGIPKK